MYSLLIIFLLFPFSYLITKKYDITEDSKFYILNFYCKLSYKNETLFYFLIHFLFLLPFCFTEYTVIENIHYCIVFSFMLSIAYIDLKCFRIPNKILFPLILYNLLYNIIKFIFIDNSPNFSINVIIGGIIAFVVLLVLAMIRCGGLGGGDVKLGFLIGMIVSSSYIVQSLCIAFIMGGLLSLLLLKNRLVNIKTYIPYGIFFVLSAYLFVVFKFDLIQLL